jgi:transcriptional regulator with XRE-family HTH domain
VPAVSFGTRLAAVRVEAGLTQVELARRVGLSASYLNQLEAGRNQPTLEILRNLAVTLAVSIDALAFDADENPTGDDPLVALARAAVELPEADRAAIATLIDALLYRHRTLTRRAGHKRHGPAPIDAAPPPRRPRRTQA